MINRRLTSVEAAARLGIKPATLYAYVSRGLLHPERSPKGSTFDLQEVVQLARSARHPSAPGRRSAGSASSLAAKRLPGPGGGDPVFVTELTLIDDGRLYFRGRDAVELSRTATFEQTAEWLWTGEPVVAGLPSPKWVLPETTAMALGRALESLPEGVSLLERYMAAVLVASFCDDLRHDLTPSGVPVTGRVLISVMAACLPGAARSTGGGAAKAPSISTRVWRGLTGRAANASAVAALEAALVLAADHELAPSTMAGRVAAAFRADPYAVVMSALGPASGSWQSGSTGAPSEVESLLREAEAVGAERAIGDRLRRTGEVPHGFGMPLYPDGDPRAAELLDRLEGVGPARRVETVRRLVGVGRARGFAPPNFDLGLGALSYCAGMAPGAGQAIFTLGKVAGWVAHAIEEYSMPTRFRSRGDYVGPLPEVAPVS
jgi:citrate synthase